MKKFKSFTFLLLPLLFAGCGRSELEVAMDDYIDHMNEMADILETVQDEGTAMLAAPKLEAVGKKIQAVGMRMNSISGVSPQEMQETFMAYQKPMNEALSRMMTELSRVAEISGMGDEFTEIMASFNSGST